MHIHFSSAFDNGVFPPLHKQNLKPNERFVGEKGLLNILERELGISGIYEDNSARVILYKQALSDYIKKGNNPFYKVSFERDEVSVAEELLKWRDELVLGGWKDIALAGQPARLKDLAEAEKFFEQNDYYHYGMADRWMDITNYLEKQDVCIAQISVYDDRETMHPFFLHLLEILSKKTTLHFIDVKFNQSNKEDNLSKFQKALSEGKKDLVLNELDKDKSLIIFHARDENIAADFLADQIRQGYEALIINERNVSLDYSLAANGSNAAGSFLEQSNPQIIQLFKLIGVSLFWPVNIKNLLSLLQMPYLPFSRSLARKLAKHLVKVPGIMSQENENNNSDLSLEEDDDTRLTWQQIVDNHFKNIKEGDSFNEADPQKAKKKKEEFLTYLTFHESETNLISNVIRLYQVLHSWAATYPHLEFNNVKEEEVEQFVQLAQMCDNMVKTLESLVEEDKGGAQTISKEKHDRIIETLYKPGRFLLYTPQAESPDIISNPASIIKSAENVCWINWCGGSLQSKFQRFLQDSEREFLRANGFRLYDSKTQSEHAYQEMKRAIMAARNQLVFIKPEITLGEEAASHPLEADMEAIIKNPDVITMNALRLKEWGKLLHSNSKLITVEKNTLPGKEIYWEDISVIKDHHNREVESPTSIEKLIQYPFDWIIENIASIRQTRSMVLPELFTQKGDVDHRAVEMLMKQLKQSPDKIFSDDQIISAFDDAIKERGLIFLLPENRFEYIEMKRQFVKAVNSLLDIISKNKLGVEDVEIKKSADIQGIGMVSGYIDLLLRDAKNRPVIFDLKWTLRDKKYLSKIEENKDIQLALYYAMLKKEMDRNIRTGFFLFNTGNLYTRSEFDGENVKIISVDESGGEDYVLNKIAESVQFRRKEFSEGKIEIGEEFPLEDLDYYEGKDADPKTRITLDEAKIGNKQVKKRNYYSSMELFKGLIR